MFVNHQPTLQAYAGRGADELAHLCQFALLTANQPLENAVVDMRDLLAGERPATTSAKLDACRVIWNDRDAIWYQCQEIRDTIPAGEADNYLLRYVASLPRIGLVKAGFVLQMAWGLSGCLDTHNLARFGIPVTRFRSRNGRDHPSTTLRRCAEYNAMITLQGGTRRLWDGWCRHVATKYPNRFATAHHVSEAHLLWLP